MELNTIKKVKRIYLSPVVDRIELDNEISLTLESTPPAGPAEGLNASPEYFNDDPFKIINA